MKAGTKFFMIKGLCITKILFCRFACMKSYIQILVLAIALGSCKEDNSSPGEPPVNLVPPYAWNTFCMGADLSYVNELEDYGAVYRDSSVVKDPFTILKSHGANTVRVRLWHNPQWVAAITGGKVYSDLSDAEKTISRAKALGMAVVLDIHYSDEWADASHQSKPVAWEGISFGALKDSVYTYTFHVMNYLSGKGLMPEMVQLGNELNGGMLYPDGKVVNDNWQPFGELLNEGIRAVRDVSAGSVIKPLVILHVAQLQNAEWWIGKVMANAKVTDFDIVGLSHYSKWTTVKTMKGVEDVVRHVAYLTGKRVMIVETAYPWTTVDADNYTNLVSGADTIPGYPITKGGQFNYFKDLVQALINGGGSGVIYWEPAWITSPMPDLWGTGSPWDNVTLFDSDGMLLPAADYMQTTYLF